MKKLAAISILVFQLAGFSFAQSEEINSPYSPTKREWISIQLSQEYNTFCLKNLKNGCGIDFTVVDNYVDVYTTFEKRVSNKDEEKIKSEIANITQKVLNKYSWSKDFLIRIKVEREQK